MPSRSGRIAGRDLVPGSSVLMATAVAVALALFSVCAAFADAPAARIDAAIDLYWEGRFSEAVEAIEPLAETLDGDSRVLALEYLARSLVRLGNADRGRAIFKDLLRLRPEWKPDAKEAAEPEIVVFNAALAEYENEHLGGLNIRTEPERANVYVDDTLEKEPTPLTIERVPAGKHEVRVELAGFATVDTTVEVAASSIITLDLALEESGAAGAPRPFWRKRWFQLATGGVLGAGLILALAGGGGGGDEEPDGLPGFPEPPHR